MPTQRGAAWEETTRRLEALEAMLADLGDQLGSVFEIVLLDHRPRIEALEGAPRAAPSRRRSRRRSGRRSGRRKSKK